MNRRSSSTPLKPAVFHILLALSAGPRHGLGIADEIEALTSGAMRLGPATLYRSLGKMSDAGLIRETRAPEPGADPRRRFYAMTASGRVALEADAALYDRLSRLARRRGVLPAQAQS